MSLIDGHEELLVLQARWLPENHVGRLIADVVDALDVAPAFPLDMAIPADLLVKLLVYGCASGHLSSRWITRATYRLVPWRLLARDRHPTAQQLAQLRSEHTETLSVVITQVLLTCQEMGMRSLGRMRLMEKRESGDVRLGVTQLHEGVGRLLERAAHLDIARADPTARRSRRSRSVNVPRHPHEIADALRRLRSQGLTRRFEELRTLPAPAPAVSSEASPHDGPRRRHHARRRHRPTVQPTWQERIAKNWLQYAGYACLAIIVLGAGLLAFSTHFDRVAPASTANDGLSISAPASSATPDPRLARFQNAGAATLLVGLTGLGGLFFVADRKRHKRRLRASIKAWWERLRHQPPPVRRRRRRRHHTGQPQE
ncbi:MAG: transposase [Candidatus Xenobia bacterium]